MRDVIDAVVNGGPTPIDAQRAAEIPVPGLCAHASPLRGGEWVEVPDFA